VKRRPTRPPLPYTSHAVAVRGFVDLDVDYDGDAPDLGDVGDAIVRVRVSIPPEHRARWEAEGADNLAAALGDAHFAYPPEIDLRFDEQAERRVIATTAPDEALSAYLEGLEGLDEDFADLVFDLGVECLEASGAL